MGRDTRRWAGACSGHSGHLSALIESRAMKPVFCQEFVTQVKRLSKTDSASIRQAVVAILANPMAHDGVNLYPWDGSFEKGVVGAKKIIYCVCVECKKRKPPDEHTDCNGYSDDTVVFRVIYTVL